MLINIYPYRFLKQWLVVFLLILISACGDSSSSKQSNNTTDYTKNYPASNGGMLTDAMTGEPSGLIAMIAGESAASAIAGNIFNSLLKYDKNLDLT